MAGYDSNAFRFTKLGLLFSGVLLALFGAGCSVAPRWAAENTPAKVSVYFHSLLAPAPDTAWRTRLTFEETHEYEVVVSELELDNGLVLVEAFKTPNGRSVTDTHSYSSRADQVRRIFTYPAVLSDDCQWTSSGFCQLKQNEDGSKVSNIGPNFNAAYQTAKPLWREKGCIVKSDKASGIYWTITHKDGMLSASVHSGPHER